MRTIKTTALLATKGPKMFLNAPPDSDAIAYMYQASTEANGYVMNLTRVWAWRPDIFEMFAGLRTQLMGSTSLSKRDLAVLVCAAASSVGDSYCSLAWGKKLANEASPSVAAAVLRCVMSDGLTARDHALSTWARKVSSDPNATTAEDVHELRALGLTEREIFEATVFVAFRLAFSTVNDALGAQPDWELVADSPVEVDDAVNYGRPKSEPPPLY